MIVNGVKYASWIATKSGVNCRLMKDKLGRISWSFPNDEYFYDLRNEVEKLDNEKLDKEIDICILSYLYDLIRLEERSKS